MITDSELLRRYAAGSQAAFAELVERHIAAIYSTALRHVGSDAHRAQEIVQDVFTAVARNASTLSRRPLLISWLYTATRYTAAKVVRAERRRRIHEEQAHRMEYNNRDEAVPADWERVRPLLDEAIGALGEKDRAAVLWRFFQGKAFSEIGDLLGLSEDASRKRVERALEKMRQTLHRSGVPSTSAALSIALLENGVCAAPAGLAASVAAKATAAAASGTSIAVVHLMAISKSSIAAAAFIGLTAIIGITGLAIGYHDSRVLAQLQTETAQFTADRVNRLERLRGLEGRLAAVKAVPRPSGQAAASQGTGQPVTPEDRAALTRRFLVAFPEAKAAFVNDTKRIWALNLAGFFQKTGVGPDEQQRLLDDIANQLANSLEVMDDGLVPQLQQDPTGSTIRAELGETAYQTYLQERQAFPNLAMMESRLVGDASLAEPITRQQKEALRQLLASSLATTQLGQSYDPALVDWAAAQQQAQGFLTAGQSSALEPTFLSLQLKAAVTRTATLENNRAAIDALPR